MSLQAKTEQFVNWTSNTAALEQALFHGTSLNGSRPKAMIQEGKTKRIAKLSAATDTYNVVKAEFITMRLAAESGFRVAPVHMTHIANKDALLMARFDRLLVNYEW